ncbi:metallophosphoesterase [Candidatus Woesearchaeota archaeon]|nr:metallophosphoesterase [Candidatus Woesearchaeota archaeon]
MVVKLVGKSAIVDDHLIIADLHIGQYEDIREKGILLPGNELQEISNEIDSLADQANKIIINGDFKHEFGKISKSEWNNSIKLLTHLKKRFQEVKIVKGNHDVLMGPVADKLDVDIKDYYLVGNTLVTHGEKMINLYYSEIKNIIIGHQHPCIKLSEGAKTEYFKCHLVGRYKGCRLFVLPSFNDLTTGVNVTEGDIISPYIIDVEKCEIIIPDYDNMRKFGKISHWTEQ